MAIQQDPSSIPFCNLFTSPKCHVCGQVLEGCVTYAAEKYWCHNHFTCARCNVGLRSEHYVSFNGKAYCQPCFDIARPFCRVCNTALLYNQRYCHLERFFWHDTCFRCSVCNDIVMQGNFVWQDDTLYCIKCTK